jgi:two-component system, NtrC family, response regulator HydG
MLTPPVELIAYLENLGEPHILLDDRYRILSANRAYMRQFGTQSSVIGRTCYEVSHHFQAPCDQSGESCPMAMARASGQRERVLHLHHTPSGEAYVNIELVPLRDDSGAAKFFVEKMAEVRSAKGAPDTEGLIGRSQPFRDMLSLVTRVGPSMASVLLLGESGTGKELVARAVHASSARARSPLVVVECASLTETLFESELFGHEKGAFTGATSVHAGLVEAASGGTLFLDEVGDIPLPMQVKLLRLLETGTYRRVGSTQYKHSDIRVIAATHRNLAELMQQGKFREDLFHRLNTFPIVIPSLRDRHEDIPMLVEALLQRLTPQRTLQVSAEAIDHLKSHPFPGNIRELRNVLERATLLCDGDVIDGPHIQKALSTCGPATHTHCPPRPARRWTQASTSEPVATSPGTVQELTMSLLRHHLAQHQGNRAELAAKLGMSTRTLYRKLKSLGLDEPDPAPPHQPLE